MEWRKASACKADDPMCIEIAQAGEAVLIRSTQHPTDLVAATRDEFAAFVTGAKNGDFDDLT